MKVLVTGGTGFIGSNLALKLVEEGYDTTITGTDPRQRVPEFEGRCLHHSLIGLDLNAINGIDVLFHQAANNDTRDEDESEVMRANLESSVRLFEYVIGKGCKKIVYASSASVYGNSPAPQMEDGPLDPLVPYAKSKAKLDEYAMGLARANDKIKIVGLRYFNVFGPREEHKGERASMIFRWAQQMQHGNPKAFVDGEQKRDHVYVKDVVNANLSAMKAERSCVVNVGGGAAITFNHVIDTLNEVLGLRREVDYSLGKPPEGYQQHTEADLTKAKKIIGYEPRWSFEEGVRDYHKSGWLAQQPRE